MSSWHRRELAGWLSYAFASEVFVVVSLTLFLPICLEQMARDNGVQLPERTERCHGSQGCVVRFFGNWMDTASYPLYVNSASVALQALTVISIGGIADHPALRKSVLMTFATLGFTSAILFAALPSSSPLWPLSTLLAMCANVGFGVSVVAMNSYLPQLARDAVGAVEIRRQFSESDDVDAPLLADEDPSPFPSYRAKQHDRLSATTSRISSQGIAAGYTAGIILLLCTLFPVKRAEGSTLSLRLAIAGSGVWWALFSIPAALWLPSASELAPKLEAGKEIAGAWKRLWHMLRPVEVRKLRNTFKYLAAWFLLSDGLTTITSTAILFGKTALGMSASALTLVGILSTSAGIIGALLWPIFQRKIGWSNKRILITLVVLASMVPAYGCLGFIFVGKDSIRFGGLTTPGEMYALAVYFGAVYGAFQSYARAAYSELIPPSEAARWFGLFSITDKSSSFVGPLVVGIIADATHNIRYAFFFLVALVWLAVPLLLWVDVERGREAARSYVETQSSDS